MLCVNSKKMCHQYDPTEVRYFDNFKTYNDELYALEFPDEWMKNHKTGTGPECYNCLDHASWRGVLIGYCGNCAQKYDGFSRGPGFCGKAVEYIVKDRPTENSAFNTYLQGVSLEDIGNIEFNPSHMLESHYEYYDKLYNGSEYITDDDCSEQHYTVDNFADIYSELERNPNINVGDTIEYISDNQMGWMKYRVTLENEKKVLKLINNYHLNEQFVLESL